MGRYHGPKVKLSRRVGAPIADIPKHTAKELTLPGMHGYRGRRNTEYGIRLTEKQKLRFYYGLRDNMEQNAGHQVPNWLEWNPAQMTARVNALPVPEDVPFEVNMNLIIEFYR